MNSKLRQEIVDLDREILNLQAQHKEKTEQLRKDCNHPVIYTEDDMFPEVAVCIVCGLYSCRDWSMWTYDPVPCPDRRIVKVSRDEVFKNRRQLQPLKTTLTT